jgi:carboxyl-terminal processing protease
VVKGKRLWILSDGCKKIDKLGVSKVGIHKIRVGLLISSFLVVTLLLLSVIIGQDDDRNTLYKKFDIFVEVMNRVRQDYVEPVKTDEILDGAIRGMARVLDSESSYLTAKEYEQYKKELKIRTAQTGVEVIKHPFNRYAYVIKVRDNSPASATDIRVGDFIRAVDDVSTRDLPILMIELLLSGPADSEAKFSMLRTGVQDPISITIPRAMLEREEVTSDVQDDIGIITMPSFQSGTLEELQAICSDYRSRGIKEVIFDLRDNVSGDPEEAIHAAELFVADQVLVKYKTKESADPYTANSFAYDFDLAVITNESTCGPAEIFALALADTERATTIGRGTFGFGAVQRRIILEDGAFLNISYATIVGANDMEIMGTGVKPDIEIEQDHQELDEFIKQAKESFKVKKKKVA